MQSRTVRYYCCEYLQEIYTDRTACMPQNLQKVSQYSWCKHQDVMQTRCSHDVRATGRHLRLDMMTHRDSFPILHNFYRLRYIMVSFRAHPSTQKNCITEDSCILQYLRSLRSERADVAGSTDCGTVPTLMCIYFSPGEYTEYKVKSYSVQIFRTLRCLTKLNGSIYSTVQFLQPSASYEDFLRAAATTTFILLLDMTHRDALRLSRIFISLVRYLRYFLGCPPMLYV